MIENHITEIMNNLFENLNDKQLEAVKATEGKVRVVAGAGSGKTRVLAHRYAYLVNEMGIDPGNILCMTFTNKAAREMKNRIAKLVHRAHVNDFVCTIHGFCVKFLRREIHRIGYPKNFMVMDDEDSKVLAKQVMEEMHLDATNTTIKDFLRGVAQYKATIPHIYIPKIILPSAHLEAKDVDEVVRYIQLQLKNFVLDFNDIIYFTLFIMENFQDALKYWQELLNYIQVDEVQDCNGSDWAIINHISEGYGNLFIVGDPDQAIYEWRGSVPDAFIQFPADTDIVLNQNYRSTPNILDVANSIISHNENRIPKDLFTEIPADRIVIHHHAKSEADECKWISDQIMEMAQNGAPFSNFAILYRASYLSRNIEQALMSKQIKYVVWGGIRFFERKEIKDCLAYLRLIANKNDDLSFIRIINVPQRKFGKVSQERLKAIADKEGLSLYEALLKHKDEEYFATKPEVIQFLQLIDDCKGFSSFTSIGDLLDYVLNESGLEKMYRDLGEDERLENIEELKQSIRDYETTNMESEIILLDNYLQDVALYTNADYKEDGETVKLMTIHQAKGLEFPYVFISGLSEGIFPNHRSIRERNKRAEEEERRLMYVAVTRAEKALFLTESEGYDHAARTEKFPSRYLLEIKDDLLQVDGDIDAELLKNLLANTKKIMEGMSMDISPIEFEVGNTVKNKFFGVGTIIERASDTSYKVKFPIGNRFVQTKYLELCNENTVKENDGGQYKSQNYQKNTEPIMKLDVGDVVEHALLGKGTVIGVNGEDKDAITTVEFEKAGKIELVMWKVTSKILKVLSKKE